MELDVIAIVTLVLFGLLAGFLNAIVGGGGLISLPALLMVGMPPAAAIATNKLAGSLGNFTSMMTFLRAGKINTKMLLPIIPFVFISSVCGALTVSAISPSILRPLVIVMLTVVFLYTVFNKGFGQAKTAVYATGKKKWLGLGLMVIIGFYDGFFGPGTGSFIIFVLLFMGFGFLEASASSKLLNFTSNIAALLTYLLLGMVNFTYGLILGVAMVIGAYTGSKVAMAKGLSFIRLLFIVMTFVLIIKNSYDYWLEIAKR
ncbi:MAG: TSUP family transporter [Solibacillus sp.]